MQGEVTLDVVEQARSPRHEMHHLCRFIAPAQNANHGPAIFLDVACMLRTRRSDVCGS